MTQAMTLSSTGVSHMQIPILIQVIILSRRAITRWLLSNPRGFKVKIWADLPWTIQDWRQRHETNSFANIGMRYLISTGSSRRFQKSKLNLNQSNGCRVKWEKAENSFSPNYSGKWQNSKTPYMPKRSVTRGASPRPCRARPIPPP